MPSLRITTGFATLQYLYPTLGSLHVPVLLLKLRLTLAGTRRKPKTLAVIALTKQDGGKKSKKCL